MLRFDDISFAYRSAAGTAPVLTGVSLAIAPGEEVAILGANGSGKSTLARLANGILLPSAGTVSVDGIPASDPDRIRELRERVGIVFQHPDDQIVATSVEDDAAFGPENLGMPRDAIRERVTAALAAVGLAGLEGREPHLLSGGQKQRLAIAGALAMQPTYLVLDEPTSMLDPEGRSDVMAIVTRLCAQGHGVLHITHDLADVAGADRVVVLDGGRIVFEGTPGALLGEKDRLEGWGLEPPVGAQLAEWLRHLGAEVPAGAVEPAELVEAACR